MILAETILFLLNNLLGTYITYRFIRVLLPVRRMEKKRILVLFALYYVINSSTFFLVKNDFVMLFSNMICLIVIICLGYEASIVRKLLSISLVLVLGASIEEAAWYFVDWFGEARPLSVSLISNLILNVLVILLEKFFSARSKAVLPIGNSLLLTGIPGASIVLILVLNMGVFLDEKVLALGMSVIVLMNIFVFFLYAKLTEAYQRELERLTLNQQVRMYENQMGLMEESRLQTKAVRHDMKNHFLLLQKFIREGSYGEAEEYLKEIDANLQVEKEYVRTGNNAVDSILNYYLEIAEENGAGITLDVKIPDSLPVNAFDMNVILGNLMQNAVEALSRCQEPKELRVSLRMQKNLLQIGISNSFNGKAIRRGEKLLTLKEDHENHGIGMENIRNAVHKYDGELRFRIVDQLFEVDAFLILPEIRKSVKPDCA